MLVKWIFPAALAVMASMASAPAALANESAVPADPTAPVDVLSPIAKSCADDIMKRAHGLPGTTVLGPYQVTDRDVTQWGGVFPGAYATATIQTLPMVTASMLDGGTPGAAWKACLDSKILAWRAAQ